MGDMHIFSTSCRVLRGGDCEVPEDPDSTEFKAGIRKTALEDLLLGRFLSDAAPPASSFLAGFLSVTPTSSFLAGFLSVEEGVTAEELCLVRDFERSDR